jgi:hypothetical protein
MSCTPATEVSQIYVRVARCQRWSGRIALFLAGLVSVLIFRSAAHRFVDQDEVEFGTLAVIYLAPLLFQITLCVLALRRFRASYHAQVKANQLMAMELLATKATDDQVRREINQRMADVVVGKPGCCK